MHKRDRFGIRRYMTVAIATTAVIVGSTLLPAHYASEWLNPSQDALAKSSGGRSGGGSFKRSTTPRTTTPSNNNRPSQTTTSPRTNPPTYRQTQPTYQQNQPTYRQNQPGTVVVPIPIPVGPNSQPHNQPRNTVNSNNTQSGTGDAIAGIILLVVLLIIFVIVVVVVVSVLKSVFANRSGDGNSNRGLSKQEKAMWREVDNDIVTITRLQVALLAVASQVQRELSQLVADADLSTPEGLAQHLQDAVLLLLRTQVSWTHVRGSSETLKTREAAETLFNKFSIAERSKLSTETLSNMGGKVKKRTAHLNSDEGPASYIMVTLLIGTAHDKPLLEETVQTEESLEAALKTLAAIDPNYLMVLEVIWSPQEETDSLTEEELITEYSDLYQIA